jgi:D-alanyl-lipoteichoic acid acyltransferase DltB (MBOAT superfamily)
MWLAYIVSLTGAAIMAIAVTADWLSGAHRFAFDANCMMLACGGLALLVSGVTVMFSSRRRKVGEWVLVGVAALAVVMASDLLSGVDQTKQPNNARPAAIVAQAGQRACPIENPVAAKLVMLVLVAGAIGLTRLSTALPVEQPKTPGSPGLLMADTVSIGRFLSLGAQLGLLVLLIRQFNLVSPVFDHQISFLVFYGFLIHYLLPLQYRLPFFLVLCVSAIVSVFGWVQAGWLIGIGLVLIGLCHLPVSFRLRVVLLLLAGAGLAEFRAGWWHAPWSDAIWPILASMFMFRLIVYLYSLQHRKAPVSVWSSLSYFFLFPNVVFPLFPVVDYATFHRTYYDAERHLIHQRGLKWIFWGVLHLLIYRCVYYYMVIGPEEVNSVTNLARYLVSNFLLILRLSGQFHLVIGLLLLFGFNLPRIMNRFWHADSFTDFWRRANIYWRDFMQRVVFYPVYFRLRHWPATASLLCATVVVFLVTWALHAYQWFWLRGSFSISTPDVLFWSVFGALVAVNTLYDSRSAKKGATRSGGGSFGQIALHTLRIVGVFCVICLLWSIWISTSISEWVSLWAVPGPTWKDVSILAPAFLGGIALAAWGAIAARREEPAGSPAGAAVGAGEKSFFVAAARTSAPILALLIISQPIIYNKLAPRLTALVQELRTEKLSRQDVALLDRGYYENLTRIDRFNSQLWQIYNQRANVQPEEANNAPEQANNQPFPESGQLIQRRDFLGSELKPGLTTSRSGAEFHTNHWGMRDKEYEMKPPPGTCRIALLGGSPEMNPGVLDAQLWEAVLEERLNRENDRKSVTRYEILNFAVTRYTALQRLTAFETKALKFEPNIVFYIAHPTDRNRATAALAGAISAGTEIPYDYLKQVLRKAGVEKGAELREAKRRLQPYDNDIVSGTYQRIVQLCRERSIVPVYILLPMLGDLGGEEIPDHLRLARDAGFKVINLVDMFEKHDRVSLRLTPYNFHGNARYHQLTADRLYEELRKDKTLLQKLK